MFSAAENNYRRELRPAGPCWMLFASLLHRGCDPCLDQGREMEPRAVHPGHWRNVKQQDTARQEPRHRGKDARWAPAPPGLTPKKGAEGCARRCGCRKLLESPNYLQKTDRPNSPASRIINALFASIKCDFIIFVSQTTRLQGRKSSSARFFPIMAVPRNVPEKGMTLIVTPTYPDKAPLLGKRQSPLYQHGNTLQGCRLSSSWPGRLFCPELLGSSTR